MAQIRAAGIKSDLWTYNKFLSRRPIKNANAAIETPETSSLIAADTCLPGTFAVPRRDVKVKRFHLNRHDSGNPRLAVANSRSTETKVNGSIRSERYSSQSWAA